MPNRREHHAPVHRGGRRVRVQAGEGGGVGIETAAEAVFAWNEPSVWVRSRLEIDLTHGNFRLEGY